MLIISEYKKIYTKRDNKEMAIIRIEDMYGSFECMLFPKILAKLKPHIHEDNMGVFHGKVSVREGENPIIILDDFASWIDEENEQQVEVKEVEPEVVETKKLYLRFDTTNKQLFDEINEILENHIGPSDVLIKCSTTNKSYKLSTTVQYDNLLEYELLTLITKENIIYK